MEFVVVQCFSCSLFQTLQFRQTTQSPSRKFRCKVCHETQSVRKVLLSTARAADARVFIQQKNMQRSLHAGPSRLIEREEDDTHESHEKAPSALDQPLFGGGAEPDRWGRFQNHKEESDDNQGEDDDKFVTELPADWKKSKSRSAKKARAETQPDWDDTESAVNAKKPTGTRIDTYQTIRNLKAPPHGHEGNESTQEKLHVRSVNTNQAARPASELSSLSSPPPSSSHRPPFGQFDSIAGPGNGQYRKAPQASAHTITKQVHSSRSKRAKDSFGDVDDEDDGFITTGIQSSTNH